jgi:hypothetical protein
MESLLSAYGNAGASDTIYNRAVTFTEYLTLASGKAISLSGGREVWYNSQNADTTLNGTLKIRSGLPAVRGLAVKNP